MKLHTKTLGALLAASFAVLTSAHAQYTWTGVTSSDPTVGTNYSGGTAPTFGGTVSNGLVVANGPAGTNLLQYTSAEGTTVFTASLNVGEQDNNNFATNSEFDVTGGNVTFNASAFPNSIGFHSSGTSTIGVSGGVLNFVGAFQGDSLWLGNEKSATFNLSGGTVNVQDELAVSRNGSAATLNITGGVFDVQGASGTLYNGNGGSGASVINLSNGLFEETASNAINLGGNFALNFTTGSTGQFSLFGETAGGFNNLIDSGDIQINGVADTNEADFSTTTSGGQGILSLATTVPEPSTWAMLIGGFALLLGVQRLSRQRGV